MENIERRIIYTLQRCEVYSVQLGNNFTIHYLQVKNLNWKPKLEIFGIKKYVHVSF